MAFRLSHQLTPTVFTKNLLPFSLDGSESSFLPAFTSIIMSLEDLQNLILHASTNIPHAVNKT